MGTTQAPTTGVVATGSSSTGTTADMSTGAGGSTVASGGSSSTTGDAVSESGEPVTTGEASITGGASTGDGPGTTDTGDETTTGEGPDTGTETGDEPPPPKPCAGQNEPPPPVGASKPINDNPAFIQVYVNNIENLKTAGEQCKGDWTDYIYYMKAIDPSPDLFLVQQISNPAQLDQLVARMNKDLPGVFEGIIADADPWPQGSPCGKEKALQTNAIIFRQGRFSKVGEKHVWQSWANKNGECVRNNQARTRNVMIKLHDKIADRDVTVASMHWSTSSGAGADPACAKKNVIEVDEKLHKNGYAADLYLFGGDFNEPDRKDNGDPRPWFGLANGDDGGALNYRDPIYRMCQSAKNLQTCLDDNVTTKTRIDMLFAQDRDGCRARTRRAHTISFAEAEVAAKQQTGDGDPDLHYSDHRSVRAEIYYKD